MEHSTVFPQFMEAKTPRKLQQKISELQVRLMGKIRVLSIYWDGKNHVCWYIPPKLGL